MYTIVIFTLGFYVGMLITALCVIAAEGDHV